MNSRSIKLLLVVGLLALATDISAQSKPSKPGPPFKPNPSLSDQEKRGQHWFLQRCALCHLAKYSKSASVSELPVVWKSLEGLFKGAPPDKEKAVREFILKGTQNMPGFQYGLEPKEVDDLIAYMKTL